jgi:hypothetical protein
MLCAVRKGTIDLPHLDAAAVEITGSPLSARGLSAPDIAAALDVDKSLQEKRATGSPAKITVAAALDDRRRQLAGDRELLEKRKEQISASIQSLIREARRITS